MNRSPAIRGWKPEKPKRSSGLMLAAALCAAAMAAMCLTALRPREDAAALPQAMAAEEPAARPALPENIVTALPPGATRRLTITNQRLQGAAAARPPVTTIAHGHPLVSLPAYAGKEPQ